MSKNIEQVRLELETRERGVPLLHSTLVPAKCRSASGGAAAPAADGAGVAQRAVPHGRLAACIFTCYRPAQNSTPKKQYYNSLFREILYGGDKAGTYGCGPPSHQQSLERALPGDNPVLHVLDEVFADDLRVRERNYRPDMHCDMHGRHTELSRR